MISVILMMTPVPHQTSFLTRANQIALTMILMILMTIRGNVLSGYMRKLRIQPYIRKTHYL